MFPHETALEQNEYRIILVRSGSRAIWAKHESDGFRLPRVAIPLWTRPARQLQQAIQDTWSTRTIILDFLPTRQDAELCVVAEIISSVLPDGLVVGSLDELADAEVNAEERSVIQDILAGNSGCRGAFSRLGWIREAREWLSAEVSRSTDFTEDVCQFNASGTFALVRFGTRQRPAYWLKATGAPNEHELAVTTMLSRHFPRYLPPLVAAREDWNAWITEDAGQPIIDSFTLPALEQATAALAELQIQSTEHIESLLLAGCFDQRIAILKADVLELIDFLEEAMEHQTSTKVPRLKKHRLREIGVIIADACARLLELQIPDALIHNDINSSNVLFDGSRCVFTDWAEGHIGNPFFTVQRIHEQVARDERTRGWWPGLAAIYKQQWRAILTEPQIDSVFALAPLLAIFSYLYGRGKLLSSPRREDARFESYSRSLARHIDRAAQAPGLLEALCH
jgi:Phosphotransferase enzyme family